MNGIWLMLSPHPAPTASLMTIVKVVGNVLWWGFFLFFVRKFLTGLYRAVASFGHPCRTCGRRTIHKLKLWPLRLVPSSDHFRLDRSGFCDNMPEERRAAHLNSARDALGFIARIRAQQAALDSPATKRMSEAAKVLGIALPASRKQVKMAWKQRALECHPDRPDGGSLDRMKEINAARDVLTPTVGNSETSRPDARS
jgi:hypothetical protein